MQINAVSNSFFNTKIKHTSFGDKEYKHITSKPTDKYPEDFDKLDIKKSKTPYKVDMSKILEDNLKNQKPLSSETIKKIETQATRDELGDHPQDELLLKYIMLGGDPSVLTKEEKNRLEPYFFLD